MDEIFCQCVSPRFSSFKVVKFGTRIANFNIQKAQNLSGGFKMVALKQRIFVCHLESASPKILLS